VPGRKRGIKRIRGDRGFEKSGHPNNNQLTRVQEKGGGKEKKKQRTPAKTVCIPTGGLECCRGEREYGRCRGLEPNNGPILPTACRITGTAGKTA